MRHVTPDDLLSTKQAAKLLRASTRTVQRLVLTGDLTPIRTVMVGRGAHLFSRADVEALRDARAEARTPSDAA